jgi:hypothetical protein
VADAPYQQTSDYIPKTDAGFAAWILNFSTLISADWNRYDLTEADADVISDLSSQYITLFNQISSGATRTPGLIAQKDAVRAAATATCRMYAQQIRANQGVDNQDKIELGIHVKDPTPTPIPAPATAPMLNVQVSFSGEHQLRYADELTPTSRKKPYGATQLELYVYVGASATTNPDDATYVGVYTKNPIQHSFSPAQAGLTAVYFARWRTTKGLVGPWSLPVAMQIAFGGPVQQQLPEAA